jgi:hypothetical protein
MANYNNPNDAKNMGDNTIANLNKIMRLAALHLFRQVILKTPVDTGRARGNWFTTIGDLSNSVALEGRSEEETINEMIDTISSGRIKQGFFLTNNLPYIQKLEYGQYPNPAKSGNRTSNGYSKQAPEGMVRISMQQIENDLQEIIEDVVSKRRGSIKEGKERLSIND